MRERGNPPLTAACFLSSRVGRSIPHAAFSITPLSSHRYWFTVPPRASTHSWHAANARRQGLRVLWFRG